MDSTRQVEPSAGAVKVAVGERYAQSALAVEPALCCPVQYDGRFLAALPEEILQKDYGCGDPSRWLREGDSVLDLGSGAGKICFIASQVVGAKGSVIGVDMTPEMLALARKYRGEVAQKVGWSNVEFRRGRIEDLRLDLDRFDAWRAAHPAADAEREADRMRAEEPMIADDAMDAVVSNCVLNLVAPALKPQLFTEVFRVLKRGGRAVISDIVADREVPLELQHDPELWSGCISGALEERAFLRAFEAAGFHGVQIVARQAEPWQVVEGIEFRSLTVAAYKGKQGPCLDEGHSVIYRGPFAHASDDDGHLFERGVRTPVCAKTFALLGREPYQGQFERLEKDGVSARDEAAMCGPSSEPACC
ncbi:MAG: methyltransferase domain-containing protein [Planctomycetota bacterium]|nr:methyltransferase domain-containing protein [Planctomycetota bacterium]